MKETKLLGGKEASSEEEKTKMEQIEEIITSATAML